MEYEEVIQDTPDAGPVDEASEESVSDRTAFYTLQEKVIQYLAERGMHFKANCQLENDVLRFEVEVFAETAAGVVRYSSNRVY
jgi:hypothetical protein